MCVFGMSAICGNENRFEICFEPSGPIAFKAKHNELSLRVLQLWSCFIYLLQGDYVFGKDRLFFFFGQLKSLFMDEKNSRGLKRN